MDLFGLSSAHDLKMALFLAAVTKDFPCRALLSAMGGSLSTSRATMSFVVQLFCWYSNRFDCICLVYRLVLKFLSVYTLFRMHCINKFYGLKTCPSPLAVACGPLRFNGW